jgi:hypothetical protein
MIMNPKFLFSMPLAVIMFFSVAISAMPHEPCLHSLYANDHTDVSINFIKFLERQNDNVITSGTVHDVVQSDLETICHRLSTHLTDEIVDIVDAMLIKAQELSSKGFLSFYHTRPSAYWNFFADIVRVCEEQKCVKKFGEETNFFMFNPSASLPFDCIEDLQVNDRMIIDFFTSTQNNPGINQRDLGISASLFLLGSADSAESALPKFINGLNFTGDAWTSCIQHCDDKFDELLKRYNLQEKKDDLLQLYYRAFSQTSAQIFHIAIHQDEIDQLVKLTKPLGIRFKSFFGKSTLAILNDMKTLDGFGNLHTKMKKDREFVQQIQARIFVRYNTFIDPDKVKTFGHKIGFNANDQRKYLEELRQICYE